MLPWFAKPGYALRVTVQTSGRSHGNRAGRPRVRILGVAAGGDLERDAIVHRLRVRAADVEQRAGALLLSPVMPLWRSKPPTPRIGAGALHLARRLGDDVDDAVERVGAPDRGRRSADHFDLLDLVQVHRQEVPHDEPEEVLVEAAAVEQRELPGRERAGRAARRDVDVARRHLGDVHAGHRAQQLGEVLRRRALDGLRPDDASSSPAR